MKMPAAALVTVALLASAHAVNAAAVRTLDGKSLKGAVRATNASAFVVTGEDGQEHVVAATNLAHAQLGTGAFVSAGAALPNGWLVYDSGESRGLVRLDGDTFSLRVGGGSTNVAEHVFAGRSMHSDGEILCRVDAVEGGTQSFAGIMIRGLSGAIGASLACDPKGRIWFEARPDTEKRREWRVHAGPTVPFPVWLRLQKRDKRVIADWSRDGARWQTLATESTKLVAEKTWREHEGSWNMVKAACGVFASARAADAFATAQVSAVSLTLHGVRGEYFSGQYCDTLRLARLDPHVRFDWNQISPDPALDNDDFSARWTGTLVPPRSGPVHFVIDAQDYAQLWIDGREVPFTNTRHVERKPEKYADPVKLIAGKPVALKLEFAHHGDGAGVKLGWAWDNGEPKAIDNTNFLARFAATNSPEWTPVVATAAAIDTRGVLFRHGTFVAGTVTQADESAVRVSFAGQKEVPILNSRIARIVLRPPRHRLPLEVAAGRGGVFMKNGDFFESEFRGIQHGSVNVSSVLFGARKFWIDGGDPILVVLNDLAEAPAPWEVRLVDGSVLKLARAQWSETELTGEDAVLGKFTLPLASVVEIRRAELTAKR